MIQHAETANPQLPKVGGLLLGLVGAQVYSGQCGGSKGALLEWQEIEQRCVALNGGWGTGGSHYRVPDAKEAKLPRTQWDDISRNIQQRGDRTCRAHIQWIG